MARRRGVSNTLFRTILTSMSALLIPRLENSLKSGDLNSADLVLCPLSSDFCPLCNQGEFKTEMVELRASGHRGIQHHHSRRALTPESSGRRRPVRCTAACKLHRSSIHAIHLDSIILSQPGPRGVLCQLQSKFFWSSTHPPHLSSLKHRPHPGSPRPRSCHVSKGPRIRRNTVHGIPIPATLDPWRGGQLSKTQPASSLARVSQKINLTPCK